MSPARASLVLMLAPLAAAAQQEPLWEAGLGVAALSFPDYRGSSHSRAYVLPAPYFVYRGEFLKADRHGLRGSFLKTDRVDLNLSLGASLPVRSSDVAAREGMPDLKPSVEAGPSLDLTIWRSSDRKTRLDLRLPVRGAVTVESHSRFIGAQFYPHANVDFRDPAGLSGWNLGVQAGPIFPDRRYNRYFYSVPEAFATTSRPAYDPSGGDAGMQFLAAVSKRYPRFWVGGFARYDTLRGAAFEESPLVTSKRYVAAGVAISWILGASSERVSVDAFGQR
jgi:outer membrane scaffolding protein for murein synthesis (MipA/OmpV family)